MISAIRMILIFDTGQARVKGQPYQNISIIKHFRHDMWVI